MSDSSGVSPDQDSASTTSCGPIMPRSPWLASAGWTKWLGVPVEARVAAILRPTWPDLPMPVTTTLPPAASITAAAAAKAAPSSPCSACSTASRPRRSISSVRAALCSASSTPGAAAGWSACDSDMAVCCSVAGAEIRERATGGRASRSSCVSTPSGTSSTSTASMRMPASSARNCSSFSRRSSGAGGRATKRSSACRRQA